MCVNRCLRRYLFFFPISSLEIARRSVVRQFNHRIVTGYTHLGCAAQTVSPTSPVPVSLGDGSTITESDWLALMIGLRGIKARDWSERTGRPKTTKRVRRKLNRGTLSGGTEIHWARKERIMARVK
ncbi:uncharacterized protein LOC114254757 isoform X2 [Monomorium pharaonis]|uniref:uncharacterized protein LOC114254757 isoform X2 n=1 Tax=Monomorium pharaonis TaxID=307658 RepID=UPI00102E10F0|nr:uncharacterized protein LOC114254757 isoform X2 [Monomorium pharaonis]